MIKKNSPICKIRFKTSTRPKAPFARMDVDQFAYIDQCSPVDEYPDFAFIMSSSPKQETEDEVSPPQLPTAPQQQMTALPSLIIQQEEIVNKKKRKCKRKLNDGEEEVLDSGFIARAPLPIDQAERLEVAAGVDEGVYFVELMRKRFKCIRDIQDKWVARACNKKKLKYVETQTGLRDFADVVLLTFEKQFGPASLAMNSAPTRKHFRTSSSSSSLEKKKQSSV